MLMAVIALVAYQIWSVGNLRRHSQDKSVCTYQIAAAANQYFLENPERVFVDFDDLIGPGGYINGVVPVAGEDYHELFPLRRDYAALAVTMGDRRRVIVYFPSQPVDGFSHLDFRQTPDGKLKEIEHRVGGLEAYQHWLEAERKPDGVQGIKLSDGRRFEITFRGGFPDGPFRAFYADGELWAEATYVKGRPVGPHVVYARNGKHIYETTFAAR